MTLTHHRRGGRVGNGGDEHDVSTVCTSLTKKNNRFTRSHDEVPAAPKHPHDALTCESSTLTQGECPSGASPHNKTHPPHKQSFPKTGHAKRAAQNGSRAARGQRPNCPLRNTKSREQTFGELCRPQPPPTPPRSPKHNRGFSHDGKERCSHHRHGRQRRSHPEPQDPRPPLSTRRTKKSLNVQRRCGEASCDHPVRLRAAEPMCSRTPEPSSTAQAVAPSARVGARRWRWDRRRARGPQRSAPSSCFPTLQQSSCRAAAAKQARPPHDENKRANDEQYNCFPPSP